MSRLYQNKGAWWIDFNDTRGVRHRRKIGPSKRVAREVLDGIIGTVARRQYLGIIEDSAISFADFSKTWYERVKPGLKPRTVTRWVGILNNHLKPYFKGALRSIASPSVENYASYRIQAGANPQTVNRELGYCVTS